jgi:hypothetical protein
VITESEGARQSNINVAEGEKQAAILRAEGVRQSRILEAEGFSQALERIFAAARTIDERTMVLQYLETLKVIGSSPSTKYILPLELTELAQRVAKYVDRGMEGAAEESPPTGTGVRRIPPATSGGGGSPAPSPDAPVLGTTGGVRPAAPPAPPEPPPEPPPPGTPGPAAPPSGAAG